MKKVLFIFSSTVLFLLYVSSCDSGSFHGDRSISTDPATIAKGKVSFIQNCSGCHNFRQNGIGPQISGLTDNVSVDWIENFIRDSKKIIESGDERAQELFEKYKSVMPPFDHFTDDEMEGIIAYLGAHKAGDQQKSKDDGKALANPIPDTIKLSNLVVGLELVTQFPPSSENGKRPLARITKLDFESHSGNTFVLDLRGKLYKMQGNKPVVYLALDKLKPKFIHEPGLGTGFGSFAFHPEYAKNGILYTTHTESPGSGKPDFGYADSIKVAMQWVLTEWKTENPGAATFSGTERELFRANMVSAIHGIQEIEFNPFAKTGDKDFGLLYIGIGDGGSVDEGYPFLARSKDKVWGTILRIDPMGTNSANGQYGIPSDNPFIKIPDTKSLGEIYALGFRNPHRITWSQSGLMLVCNIGSSNIESVNMIFPGHDYGWPIREGTFVLDPFGDLSKVYPLPENDSIYNITYPVAQFDHDGGATAISGGFEYCSAALPELTGKFLFGDIGSGRLFFIEMADIKQGNQATIRELKVTFNGKPETLTGLCGAGRADLRIGKDAEGELFLLTKTDGKLYKLVSATMKTSNVN